jgi:hypothetical protein
VHYTDNYYLKQSALWKVKKLTNRKIMEKTLKAQLTRMHYSVESRKLQVD